jgi:fructokinase
LTAAVAGPRLTVVGEALIDLVPGPGPGSYHAKPGGSPFNVAIGLARLGHQTTLMARLAGGAFGDLLRGHAARENIDLSRAPDAAEPATLAIVGLDHDARASYSFYVQGTADWQWTEAEIARIPDDTAVLHMGSLASWTQPGDELIRAAAVGLRNSGKVLVSYDPNIRPGLLARAGNARSLVERSVCAAHIVKASREDASWLYGGASLDQVSSHWLDLGALLVIITDGPDGAHLFQAGAAPVHRPGRDVRVADTIGAGDAFTAGLLSGLARRGLHTPERVRECPPGPLAGAVDEAILISGLTCERAGADPPSLTSSPRRDPTAPLTLADLEFRPLRHGRGRQP